MPPQKDETNLKGKPTESSAKEPTPSQKNETNLEGKPAESAVKGPTPPQKAEPGAICLFFKNNWDHLVLFSISLLWLALFCYRIYNNPFDQSSKVINILGMIMGISLFVLKYFKIKVIRYEDIKSIFENDNYGLLFKESIYINAILCFALLVREYYPPICSDYSMKLWRTSSIGTDIYQINAILSSAATIIVSGIAITSPILQSTWSQLLDSVYDLNKRITKPELKINVHDLLIESETVGKYLFRPFIMFAFRLALVCLILEFFGFLYFTRNDLIQTIRDHYQYVFFLFSIALLASCSFLIGILFLLSARIARRKADIQTSDIEG
jgi:hypothetical protein